MIKTHNLRAEIVLQQLLDVKLKLILFEKKP